MKPKTFKAYSDAQHGWIAVKRKLLETLNIDHLISPYSYQNGKTVYLEEDMDASTFIIAFAKRYGYKPIINEGKWKSYSPIRYYESYHHNSMNVIAPDRFFDTVLAYQNANRE